MSQARQRALNDFFRHCPGTRDGRRWLSVLQDAPYPFCTLGTAYNLATGKQYKGRNVTTLCGFTRERHYPAAIFLSQLQAERLGGHIDDPEGQAEVVLLRHVPVQREEDNVASIFLKKASIVYHYSQVQGIPDAQLVKKMQRIESIERAFQFARALPTFRTYWPNAPVPEDIMWPADLFYRQALREKPLAFHALVTSMELCREAQVTWTLPDHPGVTSCMDTLWRQPSQKRERYLRTKLYQWRLPLK